MNLGLVHFKFNYWISGDSGLRFSQIFTNEKINIGKLDPSRCFRMKKDFFRIEFKNKNGMYFKHHFHRNQINTSLTFEGDLDQLTQVQPSYLFRLLLKEMLSYIPRGITLHFVFATVITLAFIYPWIRTSALPWLVDNNSLESFPVLLKKKLVLIQATEAIILLVITNFMGLLIPVISYFIQMRFFTPVFQHTQFVLRLESAFVLFISLNVIYNGVIHLQTKQPHAIQTMIQIPQCLLVGSHHACSQLEIAAKEGLSKKRVPAAKK